MLKLVHDAGLADRIEVDSAGTAAYHAGERPDRRSAEAAARRGIELPGVARAFTRRDFARFDYVLAADQRNLEGLHALARTADERAKLHLLRSFDAGSPPDSEVPDPYYGGDAGFDHVLDLCEAACRGLLAHIRAK